MNDCCIGAQLQFINAHTSRTVIVNVTGGRAVTVSPGQLISLPVRVGLEVGLTPIDEHGIPIQKPPEELVKIDEITKAPQIDSDAIADALAGRIDEALAISLGKFLSGDKATLELILQKIDGIKTISPDAQQTPGMSNEEDKGFIPMQEDYFERQITIDTSKIKVDSATTETTDNSAADELAALLGNSEEKK